MHFYVYACVYVEVSVRECVARLVLDDGLLGDSREAFVRSKQPSVHTTHPFTHLDQRRLRHGRLLLDAVLEEPVPLPQQEVGPRDRQVPQLAHHVHAHLRACVRVVLWERVRWRG